MIKHVPKLLPDDFILGLSAGIDSVAVAHYLKFKAKKNLRCFHFHHKSETHNDFEAAEKAILFCREFDIPLVLLNSERALEKECESRDARLKAFNNQFENTNLITAHHISDAVESHFSNFFAGHESFLPIPLFSKFGTNTIFHPFLLTDKEDFIEYVKKNQLERFIAQDPTNFIPDSATRNWIRNVIIPEISKKQHINMKTIVRKRILKYIDKLEEIK